MLWEFFIIKAKVRNALKDVFKSSDSVLDVGCGDNPYYHKGIKAKISCTDLRQTKKTHFVGDAMRLPVKKGKFDGIVNINSLYYYNEPSMAIKAFANALKKNGKLVLMVPFMYPIHDAPDDKYRFTKYGIIKLLKDDFEIKNIKAIGGIFNLPAVFFHSLIKGIPLMSPKRVRLVIKLFSIIVFYPSYILAQLLSILDFIDTSGRWATYFLVVAVKK